MDVQKAKNIFFLGIGGIGMSGIARYFHQKNVAVSGYDKTYSKITNDLEEEGIEIIYSDNTSELQDENGKNNRHGAFWMRLLRRAGRDKTKLRLKQQQLRKNSISGTTT